MKKLIKLSKPAHLCRGCGILTETLESINIAQFGYELIEIDITKQPDAVEEWDISSVPVLVLIDEKANETGRIYGAVPAEMIMDKLEGVRS